MSHRKMFWQLVLPFLFIILISMVPLLWYSYHTLKGFNLEQTQKDLNSRAFLIRNQFESLLSGQESNYTQVDSLCQRLGVASSTRITVILPSGKVIGDSDEDPKRMENHRMRPEMRKALSGEIGASIRFSNTLQKSMMYEAIPLKKGKEIIGVVRVAVPLSSIKQTLGSIMTKIIVSGLVISIIAIVISLFISKRISSPLEELKNGAEQFAKGNLNHKLAIPDAVEIGRLAEAMNTMAVEINERINTITKQHKEKEAILSSMVEGVLAIDVSQRIISINKAAAKLMGLNPRLATGKMIHEVIRNTQLQQLINKTLKNKKNIEDEFTVDNDGEKFIQVHGSLLTDADEQIIGVLIVLNDLTRLRQLENMRRDFVANVSHELRTPITSIKGFVETLLDGALEKPTEAVNFLNIINKQVDRLNEIINDLLSLSRIEKRAEKGDISKVEVCIREVLESAIQICQHKATIAKVTLTLACNNAIIAEVNPPLLEQAVVNLIDNAIKYSNENQEVLITAEKKDGSVCITVKDYGCGIEKAQLERIFERFYRVDKARSRDLGGTGLGLAIVKHITLAHQGTVRVESTPGEGSSFTISLPVSNIKQH